MHLSVGITMVIIVCSEHQLDRIADEGVWALCCAITINIIL